MPKRIKKTYISIGVIIILLISTAIYFNAEIARLSWDKFHNAPITLFFHPKDPRVLFEIGNYYFNGGAYDLKTAESVYVQADEIDADYPGTHYQLARIYFLKGDFKKAEEYINQEFVVQPDFERSYYVRGLINAYSGDLEDAERDFRSFLEFDSQSWAAYNDLAFVYWKMGKYQEVKETAEKGLSFNPENAWLMITLGNALFNLKEYDRALAVSQQAEKSADTITEAMWRRAYPGHSPGDSSKGLAQMKATLYFNRALIYEKLEKPRNAIDEFEKWIALSKDNQGIDVGSVEKRIASLKNQI